MELKNQLYLLRKGDDFNDSLLLLETLTEKISSKLSSQWWRTHYMAQLHVCCHFIWCLSTRFVQHTVSFWFDVSACRCCCTPCDDYFSLFVFPLWLRPSLPLFFHCFITPLSPSDYLHVRFLLHAAYEVSPLLLVEEAVFNLHEVK